MLRYWETKFPMLRPRRTSGDQRLYRREDIELMRRIHRLLNEEKYSVEGALARLEAEGVAPSAIEENGNALPPGVDSATPGFEPGMTGLSEEQLERIRKVREDLGLLRRDLEMWREELGET